jgi:hypothetical protein
MKISDKTVIQNLGSALWWCFHFACVDVLDGRIARIRPLHYDNDYTPKSSTPGNSMYVARPSRRDEVAYPAVSLTYKKRA